MLEARACFRRCPGSGDLEIVAYKRSSCVPGRGDARRWADGGAERQRGAAGGARRAAGASSAFGLRGGALFPPPPPPPASHTAPLTEPTTSPKN